MIQELCGLPRLELDADLQGCDEEPSEHAHRGTVALGHLGWVWYFQPHMLDQHFYGRECAPSPHGIETGGIPPVRPFGLAGSSPRVPGRCAAQRTTNVEETYAGPRMRPAGTCAPPPLMYEFSLSSPGPSFPDTVHVAWRLQCRLPYSGSL